MFKKHIIYSFSFSKLIVQFIKHQRLNGVDLVEEDQNNWLSLTAKKLPVLQQ